MPPLFVQFETTGVALLGRIVPPKISEREASVIRDEVLAAAGPAGWRLALDLSGVSFLGSAALGALLAISKSCREGGGRLSIFGVQPEILGMMKIANLDRVLQISPDREGALKVFK